MRFILLGSILALLSSYFLSHKEEVTFVKKDLKKENIEVSFQEIKVDPVTKTIVKSITTKSLKEQTSENIYEYRSDEKGSILLEEVLKTNDGIIYQGDLFVHDRVRMNEFLKNNSDHAIALAKPQKWPSNKIFYTMIPGTDRHEKNIEIAVKYFNEHTNIKFKYIGFGTENSNYIKFDLGEQNCNSYLGMIGDIKNGQTISLSDDCGVKEIVHEIMHALGFIHEHSRADRDQYLDVHWENIDEVYHLQFMKFPDDFYNTRAHPFDFKSIMLYPPKTFSKFPEDYSLTLKNGDPYKVTDELLSEEDIKRVNALYPL